jgi:hypothetical protein
MPTAEDSIGDWQGYAVEVVEALALSRIADPAYLNRGSLLPTNKGGAIAVS